MPLSVIILYCKKGFKPAGDLYPERIPFVICMQEIAWQRLVELQPASDEVISRGITGLKLYMVTPFLAWVKLYWILIPLVKVLVLSKFKKIQCLHADHCNHGFPNIRLLWLQGLICLSKVHIIFSWLTNIKVFCWWQQLFLRVVEVRVAVIYEVLWEIITQMPSTYHWTPQSVFSNWISDVCTTLYCSLAARDPDHWFGVYDVLVYDLGC